ncbi:MAG: hypothetical protein RLZZ591_346 [Pseudomonadota bacterium]|jgi:hypothetical protein
MYIVPIAWLYVALMMSVAEATNSNGTLLGAVVTFVLYGLLPISIVMYLMGSPARRRAIKAREAAEFAKSQTAQIKAQDEVASDQPDAGGHATGSDTSSAVAAVRKEA